VQSSSGKVRLKFKRRVVIVGEKSRWVVVVVRGVKKEIVSTRKSKERIRAVRRVKSDVNFEEDRRSAGVRLKRSKEGGMLEADIYAAAGEPLYLINLYMRNLYLAVPKRSLTIQFSNLALVMLEGRGIDWCEDNKPSTNFLGVEELYNTFTNGFYVIVALVLFFQNPNSNSTFNKLYGAFCFFVLMTGVTSGIFHATLTKRAQKADEFFENACLVSLYHLAGFIEGGEGGGG